jgi:hypothetical protein
MSINFANALSFNAGLRISEVLRNGVWQEKRVSATNLPAIRNSRFTRKSWVLRVRLCGCRAIPRGVMVVKPDRWHELCSTVTRRREG